MTEPLLSPRAARTRFALLAAGMELLVDRPIDAISIDEFVAAAGVAKGSFFNHFTDKRQFATVVASVIRIDVEDWVGRLNAGVADPLARLAGGMVAAAAYALANPQRTAVLARSFNGTSLDDHPINAGLLHDLRDARAAGAIEIPSEAAGVLYWLGACQIVMGNIVESEADDIASRDLLADMLRMSLRGLGATVPAIDAILGPGGVLDRFGQHDRLN
ncbi:TetR/AcrR family transcriptional regulator [Glacieibacterium frigidum]|uniref:TetR/AcrR family transcriptional regulator n=1 Tax=Glacieibacterium frigidum TaxID=2593303 RepID=A0A552U997_9SPHN|nr:TetR/AcrR family transcriptional regulator [Glacieibacterium frigidum]TRW14785.1 TetR/AcrR family transcriptional regulator [Glacieibacterium frigidum]